MRVDGWRKSKTKDFAGLMGVHPSYILVMWVRETKTIGNKPMHQVVWIRKYFGDYVVEWHNVVYKPFEYLKMGFYQAFTKKDALEKAHEFMNINKRRH